MELRLDGITCKLNQNCMYVFHEINDTKHILYGNILTLIWIFQKKDKAPSDLLNMFEEVACQVQSIQPDCRMTELMKACLTFKENRRYGNPFDV